MKPFFRAVAQMLLGLMLLGGALQGQTYKAASDVDRCAACEKPIEGTAFFCEDKVTHERKLFCHACSLSLPRCFLCGLPSNTATPGYVELPDGRSLCARDAKASVLDEAEGLRLCHQVQADLDRLLSRFVSFPDNNVNFAIVDRVNLQEVFRIAGNDYQCPNVWGYTSSDTNHGRLEHSISIMSGLPVASFQATVAHELTHAWMHQNVAARRERSLSHDAREGFCELVAYLLMDDQHQEAAKAVILTNAYTRGHIHLYINTDQQFGFNDIADWIRYGVDTRLSADDPARIHTLDATPRVASRPAVARPVSALAYVPAPVTAPQTLALKAVFWDPARPSAIINGQTFGPQEEGKVRLGTTNLAVRCLSIRQNAVRIKILSTGEERELTLGR